MAPLDSQNTFYVSILSSSKIIKIILLLFISSPNSLFHANVFYPLENLRKDKFSNLNSIHIYGTYKSKTGLGMC